MKTIIQTSILLLTPPQTFGRYSCKNSSTLLYSTLLYSTLLTLLYCLDIFSINHFRYSIAAEHTHNYLNLSTKSRKLNLVVIITLPQVIAVTITVIARII